MFSATREMAKVRGQCVALAFTSLLFATDPSAPGGIGGVGADRPRPWLLRFGAICVTDR